MKIIHNKILPFGKSFSAINLFGILFTKVRPDQFLINNEKIHTAQMRELLYIPFYIAYVTEWLIRLTFRRSSFEAYHDISFEREAYCNMHDLSYLSSRTRFAFLKYLKRRKVQN